MSFMASGNRRILDWWKRIEAERRAIPISKTEWDELDSAIRADEREKLSAPSSSATPPARNEVTEAIVRWLHIIAKEGDRGTRLLALGDAEKYVRAASSPSAEGTEPPMTGCVNDQFFAARAVFKSHGVTVNPSVLTEALDAAIRTFPLYRRSPFPAGTPAQEPTWKVITEDAPVQEIVVPVAAPGELERVTPRECRNCGCTDEWIVVVCPKCGYRFTGDTQHAPARCPNRKCEGALLMHPPAALRSSSPLQEDSRRASQPQ